MKCQNERQVGKILLTMERLVPSSLGSGYLLRLTNKGFLLVQANSLRGSGSFHGWRHSWIRARKLREQGSRRGGTRNQRLKIIARLNFVTDQNNQGKDLECYHFQPTAALVIGYSVHNKR